MEKISTIFKALPSFQQLFSHFETFTAFICLIIGALDFSKPNWDEDAELVRQTKKGNRHTYGQLFDKYHESIYRYCFLLLSRRIDPVENAKDATQKAFMKCLENINSLQKDNTYFSWLKTTAYHVCMDIIREPQPPRTTEQEDPEHISVEIPDMNANPEEDVLKKEIKEAVHSALNSLDEKYRVAVINVHLMGYKYEEAAQIMGCKISDVKTWVHRGILKLKDLLKDYRG